MISKAQQELQEGMGLAKCRQCGCMKETLESIQVFLRSHSTEGTEGLQMDVDAWGNKMLPIKYACLGCAHCYPVAALDVLQQVLPKAADALTLSCAFEVRDSGWPPVAGEYFAMCDGTSCPTAVSTLASVELTETLAITKPKGLCIVGKTETENIGIDKVVKNIITNPTIRFLIVAGREPEGHLSGKTLVALWQNGVDQNGRVIGSPGKRPMLRNVSVREVEAFRKQVQVVDMVGCEDSAAVIAKVIELSDDAGVSQDSQGWGQGSATLQISPVPIIQARGSAKVELDKAGYFVILPQLVTGTIMVEHYSYDNKLLHVITGKDARSIYQTLIANGWVTQLSHAAYLGKELANAQLSLQLGFRYVQDGA